MTAVYSTRLLESIGSSAADFVVPTGNVAVVRSITGMFAATSGAGNYAVFNATTNFYVVSSTVAAVAAATVGKSDVWDLRYVLLAGEHLRILAATNVHVSVSGYLFST